MRLSNDKARLLKILKIQPFPVLSLDKTAFSGNITDGIGATPDLYGFIEYTEVRLAGVDHLDAFSVDCYQPVSLLMFALYLFVLALLRNPSPKPIISSVELELQTRGSLKSIRMSGKQTQVIINGDTTTVPTPAKHWQHLLKQLDSVNLPGLATLKTNTSRSMVDADYIAYVRVATLEETYESAQFDYGTPPRQLALLMKILIEGTPPKTQKAFR